MDSSECCNLLIYLFPSQETTTRSEHVVQVLSAVKGVSALKEYKQKLILCNYLGSQDQPLSAVKSTIERECSLELMLCSDIKYTTHGVRIRVEGMTCQSCVKLIESTISALDEVAAIKVSLTNKEAFVVYNSQQTNPSDVSASICDMGFDADVLETFTNLCDSSPASEQAVVHVEGMVCNSCVQNIESNVGKIAGVSRIKVSLEDKTAVIVFDASLTSTLQLTEAIEDLGFEASYTPDPKSKAGKKRSDCIGIDGMTCQSCVKLIESTIGELPGVVSIEVSLERREGVVEYNDALITQEQIREAIDNTGFSITYIKGKNVVF